METTTLGRGGPVVSRAGLGLMGMSGIYGQADDQESIATIHAAAGRRDHAARHRRLLRHGPQRAAAARRAAPRGPPGERVHPGEVRRAAGPVRRLRRARRQPGRGEELAGLHADQARHRLRRPVPAGQAGPAGADRGDRRGHRRDGPGRIRPAHRAVRGGGGDHPPGARGPPDRRAADRVLADEPRHRGGDPARRAGARHQRHRLRHLVPRPAEQRHRPAGAGRPAHPLPPVLRREPRAEPGAARRARGDRRTARGDRRPAGHRLGGLARRGHHPADRDQAPGPAGRGAQGARPDAERGRPGRDRGRRAAPPRSPGTGTPRPRSPPSTASARTGTRRPAHAAGRARRPWPGRAPGIAWPSWRSRCSWCRTRWPAATPPPG